MGIVYDEWKPKSKFTGNMWAMDANKCYMTHFENALLLGFILKNSTNTIEKCQASKELAIADRKMDFWARHHSFNQKEIEKAMSAARGKWS